mmetsp:Transcript_10299/g.24273  ORF Transcript_10299/g.24273 Transcript_10299/m.24273 type:complete len:150 (+) Transcript_10299:111-560(+)
MAPLKTTEVFEAHFDLAAPHGIDDGFLIFEVTDGYIKGEGISGKALTPAGDWMQVNNGIATLDVRGQAKMDDDSLLYFEYKGRAVFEEGGGLKDNYLAAVPLYRTTSEKYGYLTQHQYVAKMTDMKMPEGPKGSGKEGFIEYAVYRIDP